MTTRRTLGRVLPIQISMFTSRSDISNMGYEDWKGKRGANERVPGLVSYRRSDISDMEDQDGCENVRDDGDDGGAR